MLICRPCVAHTRKKRKMNQQAWAGRARGHSDAYKKGKGRDVRGPFPSSSRHSLAPSTSAVSSTDDTTRMHSARQPFKRGRKLLEFHDGTCIPPSDNLTKPVPPARDIDAPRSRFSHEEKIFFIRYLRWRLREGQVPSKAALFQELAKEVNRTH